MGARVLLAPAVLVGGKMAEFNWCLNILTLYCDIPLMDHRGHCMVYRGSGHCGWDLYLDGKRILEDVDGLQLCAELNAAQVAPASRGE